MNYQIVHRTTYKYAAPVTVSHHVTRLDPRDTATQVRGEIRPRDLPAAHPAPLDARRIISAATNLCFFSIQEVHQHLEIVTTSRVTVRAPDKVSLEDSPAWEEVAQPVSRPGVAGGGRAVPVRVRFDPRCARRSEMADYARESFTKGAPLLVGARGPDPPHLQGFQIRPQGDDRGDAAGGGLEETARRVPGFCPPGHRLPQVDQPPSRAVRRAVACAPTPTRGQTAARGGRCLRTRGFPSSARGKAGLISTLPTTF